MITIIGIPFALQTLKLAVLELWPFGAEIRAHERQPGCLSTLMNLIWLFVGGVWIFLAHIRRVLNYYLKHKRLLQFLVKT